MEGWLLIAARKHVCRPRHISRPYLAPLLRRPVNKDTGSRSGLPEAEVTSLLACRALQAAFRALRVGSNQKPPHKAVRPLVRASVVRPFSEETFGVRENNPSLSRQPARRRCAAAPSNSKYGGIACPSPLAGRCTYRLHRSAVGLIYWTQYRPIFTDWMIGMVGAPRPIE